MPIAESRELKMLSTDSELVNAGRCELVFLRHIDDSSSRLQREAGE